MPRLPNTKSEVFYSYVIQIDGINVGTLQEFNPSQSRTFDHVREILTNGGEIKEIVPGVPTYSISLNKVRLYKDNLLDAFGILAQDIQKQVQAIDIIETMWTPAEDRENSSVTGPAEQDGTGAIGRTITWGQCWVTEWGKSVSSTGSVIVIDNMTVQCTKVS